MVDHVVSRPPRPRRRSAASSRAPRRRPSSYAAPPAWRWPPPSRSGRSPASSSSEPGGAESRPTLSQARWYRSIRPQTRSSSSSEFSSQARNRFQSGSATSRSPSAMSRSVASRKARRDITVRAGMRPEDRRGDGARPFVLLPRARRQTKDSCRRGPQPFAGVIARAGAALSAALLAPAAVALLRLFPPLALWTPGAPTWIGPLVAGTAALAVGAGAAGLRGRRHAPRAARAVHRGGGARRTGRGPRRWRLPGCRRPCRLPRRRSAARPCWRPDCLLLAARAACRRSSSPPRGRRSRPGRLPRSWSRRVLAASLFTPVPGVAPWLSAAAAGIGRRRQRARPDAGHRPAGRRLRRHDRHAARALWTPSHRWPPCWPPASPLPGVARCRMMAGRSSRCRQLADAGAGSAEGADWQRERCCHATSTTRRCAWRASCAARSRSCCRRGARSSCSARSWRARRPTTR